MASKGDGSRERAPWQVGETYSVDVPQLGSVSVTIEDLSDIATNAVPGRNTGANSPMTQALLQIGARRLAAGLQGLSATDADNDGLPTPAVLSHLVGYDAVATSVGLAKNQMRRRWTTAGAWYADLTSFMLRPGAFATVMPMAMRFADEIAEMSFGALLDAFSAWRIGVPGATAAYQAYTVIRQLLPEYEPVQRAMRRDGPDAGETWAPVFEAVIARYGLRARDGVAMAELVRLLLQMVTQESIISIGNPEWALEDCPELGRRVSRMGRGSLLVCVGNLERVEPDGTVFIPTMRQLDSMMPVARPPATSTPEGSAP